jgi:hypothetical protein
MINNRYDVKWVGRCRYDGSDKIWGWFFYIDPTISGSALTQSYAYVFWGPTGKTLSFKRHPYSRWEIDRMVGKKINRKYSQITEKEFISLWNGEDNLYEIVNNKFIFHLLANDI